MPLIWSLFWSTAAGLLVELASFAAGRVIFMLGFGSVAYGGLKIVTSNISDMYFSQLHGLPAVLYQFALLMNLDTAFNMYLSAVLVKLTLQGLTGNGWIFRRVFKVPSKQTTLF